MTQWRVERCLGISTVPSSSLYCTGIDCRGQAAERLCDAGVVRFQESCTVCCTVPRYFCRIKKLAKKRGYNLPSIEHVSVPGLRYVHSTTEAYFLPNLNRVRYDTKSNQREEPPDTE